MTFPMLQKSLHKRRGSAGAEIRRWLWKSILPASILAFWALATRFHWVDRKIWASPAQVWQATLGLNRDGFLWLALGESLLRDLAGFLLGAAAGLAAGGVLGWSPWAYRLGAPTLHFLKAIAIFAWIPLLTMVFGIGEASKIVFIALAAFYPAALNTLEGIRSVPKSQLELARAYRLDPWQRLRKVILPSALPSILTGVQVALILTWLATVGVEYFMSAGPSVGGILLNGAESFHLEIVFIGIILLGSVGFALNQGAHALGRRLLRHRPQTLKA
ncbi:MAG: transporter permease [Fibrobacteres bacterium]|nr:transporter permease [Fibrobacterota bacterium]